MNRRFWTLFAAIGLVFAAAACSTEPATNRDKLKLVWTSHQALERATSNDPTLASLLREAAGYAVFPSVTEGAVGVGGAYGRGDLYENDSISGFCDLSQGSVGVQLGGQKYTEIIVFETQETLDAFKQGQYSLDIQSTAIALKSGAGAKAKYAKGVVIFTIEETGLMYQASVGGQKFSYKPR